ncbi:hypothetical protein MKX03_019134 [Papaver bracteatum]|nr:hypothetical protein MKX03_019134 [Papaver bracteatum]
MFELRLEILGGIPSPSNFGNVVLRGMLYLTETGPITMEKSGIREGYQSLTKKFEVVLQDILNQRTAKMQNLGMKGGD